VSAYGSQGKKKKRTDNSNIPFKDCCIVQRFLDCYKDLFILPDTYYNAALNKTFTLRTHCKIVI